jgi:hypothetical protein
MVLAKIELGRDVHCCGRFPKPLITSLVLSRVCGSIDQAVCQVFQKGAFLEHTPRHLISQNLQCSNQPTLNIRLNYINLAE